jgi:hypothetical protein
MRAVSRRPRGLLRSRRRAGSSVQDAVAMDVLRRIVAAKSPSCPRGDHRDLALERHEALRGSAARRPSRRKRRSDRGAALAEHMLALAVIAEPAGLQHAVAAESGKCGGERRIVSIGESGPWDADRSGTSSRRAGPAQLPERARRETRDQFPARRWPPPPARSRIRR